MNRYQKKNAWLGDPAIASCGCCGLQRGFHTFRRGWDTVSIDNPIVQTEQSQFQTIGHAQLVVNLAQVVLDDLFRGTYAMRDFFVLHALSYTGDNYGFFGRQLHLRTGAGWTRGVVAESI